MDLTVERGHEMPAGAGIVAVLVPPEIPVGAAEIARLPDLRLVAATSTGFDHLDLDAIADAGLWGTHCAGYCDEEVAEHALAFILDLLRGITLDDRFVHGGGWLDAPALPRRIGGSTLGIVGLGRIGRELAWRAAAVGMHVLASDPFVTDPGASGVALVALDQLLRTSDVVSIHAALSAENRGLIGAAELALMKPDAFLVNCSRTALVDHGALGEALRAGRLAGCALDVLPAEPLRPDEPTLAWPNTLITPHLAYYSPATADAPYVLCGEAVAAVLAGREPRHALARPAG